MISPPASEATPRMATPSPHLSSTGGSLDGNRLVATPFAQQLAPRLAAAVEHLERIVRREHVFDAAQSVRTFTLACSDWTQVCDVPLVFEAFRRRMPRAGLRIISTDAMLGGDALAGDDIDIALGPPDAAGGLHYEALYAQGGVLVIRKTTI
jgi:DNA-binding transcriptional LysR family regulator